MLTLLLNYLEAKENFVTITWTSNQPRNEAIQAAEIEIGYAHFVRESYSITFFPPKPIDPTHLTTIIFPKPENVEFAILKFPWKQDLKINLVVYHEYNKV